jgi:hypothetical protein
MGSALSRGHQEDRVARGVGEAQGVLAPPHRHGQGTRRRRVSRTRRGARRHPWRGRPSSPRTAVSAVRSIVATRARGIAPDSRGGPAPRARWCARLPIAGWEGRRQGGNDHGPAGSPRAEPRSERSWQVGAHSARSPASSSANRRSRRSTDRQSGLRLSSVTPFSRIVLPLHEVADLAARHA